jgi:hypothetical protein
MILVKDLDLITGFTDRHTAILSPEMLNHGFFSDTKIPLRTRILVDLSIGGKVFGSFCDSQDESTQPGSCSASPESTRTSSGVAVLPGMSFSGLARW